MSREGDILDELCDLDGRLYVLTQALRDIAAIADDYLDYDTTALHRILGICRSGGVRAAMDPTE